MNESKELEEILEIEKNIVIFAKPKKNKNKNKNYGTKE